jgi:hypothetical protein
MLGIVGCFFLHELKKNEMCQETPYRALRVVNSPETFENRTLTLFYPFDSLQTPISKSPNLP